MKYARLTQEQFEELHPEFINFLASQTIDKNEWDELKAQKPEVAEQELDVFSDLIWEGVLSRTRYLEHFSNTHVFLFECFESHIESIIIKSLRPDIDLLSQEGLQWLNQEMFGPEVEIRLGRKNYTQERNADIFSLIQQGAYLSGGEMYQQLMQVIRS
ncbi:hypothetical protein KIH23_05360 [Flavobacterium sp. CYK-55]|uniref:DUF6495 family protein n=1 Tax=Flavobacterium sp. CYK-55 TaxID=2835529 RepID=UPI001BCECFE8|nr:DUF6495 family protein [Flavobacterium sp. CYK-55]MBS7786716.1 hypothetical protein [Flavobacterium sp. CYK-55]